MMLFTQMHSGDLTYSSPCSFKCSDTMAVLEVSQHSTGKFELSLRDTQMISCSEINMLAFFVSLLKRGPNLIS